MPRTVQHNKHRGNVGEPLQYDPDFNGPLRSRSCTDVIFLIIFLLFVACWIGIAIFAYTNGDPKALLVPVASDGSRCGWDSHVRDKPYLFFFDLTKCISIRVPFTKCKTTQICVSKCPSQAYYRGQPGQLGSLDRTFCNGEECPEWYLPSKPLIKRCVPIFDEVNENDLNTMSKAWKASTAEFKKAIQDSQIFLKVGEVGQGIVDDIISAKWAILIGVIIVVFANLLYILIMRWIAPVMVWLSIIGAVVALGAGAYFSTKHYLYLKNELNHSIVEESIMTNKSFWLTLTIIVISLLLILLLVLIVLRKRIMLAIQLIKEGSKAVASVTSVLVFPIFPWILQIGVIVFAISCGLYLASTGEPEYLVKYKTPNQLCPKEYSICNPNKFQNNNDCYCKYIQVKNEKFYPYLQAINVFGFFWGVFFISALGQMILASVFATWYWTFKKRNLPFFAVTESSSRVLRYHIGTLAFGSLIIAICRMIRVIIEYIDHKLKKYDNEITKAIMCCLKCFFWCLEKFLKFINRNAYIMCAIHGKNFCSSAKDAFMLLSRNLLRFFVLDKVTDFLFFLSKILLMIGVGAVAYVCFATNITGIDNSYLKYSAVPIILLIVITYFVASLFFNVYSMAVDTLFLCFLEDCERNDGTPEKPYYMSRDLMKIFGKKNKGE